MGYLTARQREILWRLRTKDLDVLSGTPDIYELEDLRLIKRSKGRYSLTKTGDALSAWFKPNASTKYISGLPFLAYMEKYRKEILDSANRYE